MKLILQAIKALFRKIEASRTHWDTRRIVTKEYIFDGNIDGKETIQIMEDTLLVKLVKVADTFPEVSSITSLSVATTNISDGQVQEFELSPTESIAMIADGIYAIYEFVLYASIGGEVNGVHIPSGLYFVYRIDNRYISKLSVAYNDGELKKLDKKYLPDEVIDSIGIANNAQTTANNAQTTANSKMNANNPVGTGSFSMGRKANSVVGSNSHAEGLGTTASGSDSHAEGFNTTARGVSSHAEGFNTTASGDYSHAEGSGTTASKNYSHAEGYRTTASGSDSHAEGGNTTASGSDSHAEGVSTTASGSISHAEGAWTIAGSSNQHVQGKYNVKDSQSKYAHIVGNGVSSSSRSNAHTLDWNGVPWYQGRPQFGGTAMDNGSQTVMANGDKEIILASSTSNSTKKFKITVDDSGALSAIEVTT